MTVATRIRAAVVCIILRHGRVSADDLHDYFPTASETFQLAYGPVLSALVQEGRLRVAAFTASRRRVAKGRTIRVFEDALAYHGGSLGVPVGA